MREIEYTQTGPGDKPAQDVVITNCGQITLDDPCLHEDPTAMEGMSLCVQVMSQNVHIDVV